MFDITKNDIKDIKSDMTRLRKEISSVMTQDVDPDTEETSKVVIELINIIIEHLSDLEKDNSNRKKRISFTAHMNLLDSIMSETFGEDDADFDDEEAFEEIDFSNEDK
jgi:hypothetical protein